MKPYKGHGVRLILDVVREPVADAPAQIGRFLSSAKEAVEVFRLLQKAAAAPMEREAFIACMLDSRHQLLAVQVISVGSLQSSVVHPREVFRAAVACGAAAIVVAHNHPSGDPSPSSEDQAITDRLKEVGTLLGIHVLDHLIIGATRFYSFSEGTTSEG